MSRTATGKIKTLNARKEGLFFGLTGNHKTKAGLFFVPLTHPNYDTYASLLIAVGVGSYREIKVYTEVPMNEDVYVPINYIDLMAE